MILLISLLVAFLIFSVLYYIIKTKVVPDNQVHQRLRDLQEAVTVLQHHMRTNWRRHLF